MERAQREVRAARKYIPTLEATLKEKQEIIEQQAKRQTLSSEAIALLNTEIVQYKELIKIKELLIDRQEAVIGNLKKELSDTNKKLKRSRAFNKYLILTTGLVIALKVIFK